MESAHNDGDLAPGFKELIKHRKIRWWKGNMGILTLFIVLCLFTSMTSGYDGSMMNGLQTLPTWASYFGTPTGSLLGVFNAAQNIGGIAGLPFAYLVSDKFGRRAGIFLGSVIMLIGVAIQSGSQSIGMFIGARCLIGFGLTFSSIATPVLITELAFPTYRGPLTGLFNSTWYLGSIVAAWSTFGTFRMANEWAWRIPSILQGVPSVIQVALIYLIPESPRWLVDHGKDDRAISFFVQYHCEGDASDPVAEFEYQEIKNALAVEKELTKGATFKSLFATKGNRKRMSLIIPIAVFGQWSGNGLVSFYLAKVLTGIGYTTPFQQNLINGMLQLFNYATAIAGALLVDRAGRRPLLLASTGGMTICFTIWTACSAIYTKSAADVDSLGTPIHPDNAAGKAVLAMIFLYYFFYNIGMSPLTFAYTVEILPFQLRAKGLTIFLVSAYCAQVFNQYVNPIALDALNWKYYIFYCVWLAIEFTYFYFFLIETKGPTLEEIGILFDGPGGAVEPVGEITGVARSLEGEKGEIYEHEGLKV